MTQSLSNQQHTGRIRQHRHRRRMVDKGLFSIAVASALISIEGLMIPMRPLVGKIKQTPIFRSHYYHYKTSSLKDHLELTGDPTDKQESVEERQKSKETMPVVPLSTAPQKQSEVRMLQQNFEFPRKSSSVVSETRKIPVPTVRQILTFAIPAVAIWLCNPLLSMIDTSTVGLFAGTAQQAALSPAVAVTDYSARTMSFLYTGTTNKMAVSLAEDSADNNGKTRTTKAFVGALKLSVWVGIGLSSFLLTFAKPMLRALIGNDSLDPEVMSAAMKYVRIRALGMPAAAMIGTAQAACLGMKDVKSPLRVLGVAALANFAMDIMLVPNANRWIGGAAGAAWATAISQYFAAFLFLRWLITAKEEKKKPPKKNISDVERFRSIFMKKPNEVQTTRGLLANQLSFRSLLQRPDNSTTSAYAPYVVPVTTTQVGRCSTYIAMGHVVSSSFGEISMAANQIITSIFYSLIPIADSLSLTAQSFLPGIVTKEKSKARANAIKQTILNLYKVAGMVGCVLAGVVACIPLISRFFTSDPAVMSLVAKIVPILFTIFSLHGVFCGSEGILLGQRDLTFLGRMYAVYFAVVPYLMLRIKYAAQSGAAVSLQSVWSLFLSYQLFRIAVWVGRVTWLQRRTDKEVEEPLENPAFAMDPIQ